ncbi:MAG: LPS assembly protein LptD [Xanthomonadales bacterium]|nr:LPS assembly protein LptD [Xanthomonadales bacterium]
MIRINSRASILITAIGVALMVFWEPVFADETGVPQLSCPGPSLAPMVENTPDRSDSPISVKTRQFDARKMGMAVAREEVELRRADQVLTTELLEYDTQTEIVTMPGKVSYEDSVMYINGTSAKYNFLEESGEFIDVDYGIVGSSARGTATEVTLEAGDHSILHHLQFTTCPGETPEWLLRAKELDLDFEEGMGTVKGAQLRFFDIPFLYLPYMTFPIDDRRKSGFLYPYISTANDNGFEFSIPYYWNIAPNQDATITPRYFTERGFMLTGEYRFMTRRTVGELDFDYLHDDKKTGERRFHYRFAHTAQFSPRWYSQLLVDRVSDDQYFQDFSNSLASASRQYLRSKYGIYGSGRFWQLRTYIDDFQVVDEAVNLINKPYTRLPRVVFDLDQPLGIRGLGFQLDAELVYFDRDIGVTGARLDIYPRFMWNIETNWGYVRPSAGYRYTLYDLNWHQVPGDLDRTPDRGTEILSFDTGLFFERDGKNGNLQTLEPRLFYLYVPYEDQKGIPIFDTAPYTFGFSQLFHYNRFTGADRQSDANQLTLALTTRTIDQVNGRELWSLSFGQILYFEDQRVLSIDDIPLLSEDSSPFIAELVVNLTNRLNARIGTQWSWQDNNFDVAVLGATYTSPRGLRLGAEYRYRRGSVDQFDIRYYQPINESWRALARVNYSLLDSDLLSAEAGIEYDSCCWAIRMVAKRFLRNREGDHRDALYVQLVLKGLGDFGRKTAPLFYDLAY